MTPPLFNVILVLLLIMDPIGNLATFESLVQGLTPKLRYKIVFREMSIALALMLFFNFLGEYIFDFLALSETTVAISAGVILFLIGIKILFMTKDSPRASLPKGEPFIFPLAVPLIAGPGLLATIMLYSRIQPLISVMLIAIATAWILSVLVLLFAAPITRLLGTNGLQAFERLIGMILVIIAVQRFMGGVFLFITEQSRA